MTATLDTGVHWTRRGACATEDPDLCYPEGRGYALEAAVNRALAVCRRCPTDVVETCLAVALAEPDIERLIGKVAGGQYHAKPTQKAITVLLAGARS